MTPKTIDGLIKDDDSVLESYDLVCVSEIVDHAVNKRDFLHKCISLLKPGGHLAVS